MGDKCFLSRGVDPVDEGGKLFVLIVKSDGTFVLSKLFEAKGAGRVIGAFHGKLVDDDGLVCFLRDFIFEMREVVLCIWRDGDGCACGERWRYLFDGVHNGEIARVEIFEGV